MAARDIHMSEHDFDKADKAAKAAKAAKAIEDMRQRIRERLYKPPRKGSSLVRSNVRGSWSMRDSDPVRDDSDDSSPESLLSKRVSKIRHRHHHPHRFRSREASDHSTKSTSSSESDESNSSPERQPEHYGGKFESDEDSSISEESAIESSDDDDLGNPAKLLALVEQEIKARKAPVPSGARSPKNTGQIAASLHARMETLSSKEQRDRLTPREEHELQNIRDILESRNFDLSVPLKIQELTSLFDSIDISSPSPEKVAETREMAGLTRRVDTIGDLSTHSAPKSSPRLSSAHTDTTFELADI